MQNVSLPPISQLLATLPIAEPQQDAPSSPSSVTSSHSCLSTASLSSMSSAATSVPSALVSAPASAPQKFFETSRSYTTAQLQPQHLVLQKKMSFSADDYKEIHARRGSTSSASSSTSSVSSPIVAKTHAVAKNSSATTARHIPRPRNAFILFRQHMHRQLFPKLTKDKQNTSDNSSSFKTNSECSREIGLKWRNLDPEEKKYWNELARKEKEWHRMKYPNYKYTPTKKATPA